MILTLDAKRRLTLPASLIPAQPGDHFQAEFDPKEDAVVFRRIAKKADWLSVLRAGCSMSRLLTVGGTAVSTTEDRQACAG
jgi:hypothetical protein